MLAVGEVAIRTDSGSHHHLQSLEGVEIQLTCQSSDGSQVDWSHNSTSIGSDERRLLRNSVRNDDVLISELTIANARSDDSGLYICQNRKENFDSDQILITVTSDDSLTNDKRKIFYHYNSIDQYSLVKSTEMQVGTLRIQMIAEVMPWFWSKFGYMSNSTNDQLIINHNHYHYHQQFLEVKPGEEKENGMEGVREEHTGACADINLVVVQNRFCFSAV